MAFNTTTWSPDALTAASETSSETLNNATLSGTLTVSGASQLNSALTLGVDDTGVDLRVYSATASEGLLYDSSEDEFGLLLTTKLKFHDIGGGEEIFASANGHLEINAGTTLDITAPTVDINAATLVQVDGPISVGTDGSGHDVTFYGNTSTRDMFWDASANTFTFKDNAQMALGSASDCTFKHTGSATNIVNTTGELSINSTTSLNLGTGVSSAAVSIGHTTSETTVNDNLTVTGTLTGTITSVTNLTDDGSIPITATCVNIDANGSARTGIRFAGTGTAGQIIIVNNTGGEALTFHNTEATALVRGIYEDNDTMEANFVGMFVSDGSLWTMIGGGIGTRGTSMLMTAS